MRPAQSRLSIALRILLFTLPGALHAQPVTVAGLVPDRRPEGAPVVTAVPVTAAEKARRMAGVERPWAGNLERIAEQGPWFSPLFQPGMTGRYDLLGRHAERKP